MINPFDFAYVRADFENERNRKMWLVIFILIVSIATVVGYYGTKNNEAVQVTSTPIPTVIPTAQSTAVPENKFVSYKPNQPAVQNNPDYDLRPCINQFTGEYAYFKTEMINSNDILLTFVNQSGDIVVEDLDNNKIYSLSVYEGDFCKWKQISLGN